MQRVPVAVRIEEAGDAIFAGDSEISRHGFRYEFGCRSIDAAKAAPKALDPH